jgi:aspartyl-tRNA(Asn)/glutamyl-tRNA(Gln) amidotransferase subunit A
MHDALALPIRDIAEQVRQGKLGAEELARSSLESIEGKRELNAFLHVARDAALAAARKVDEKRARGEELGSLAGVPIAVKDALATRDAPTTCGSRMLESWQPVFDATVIERLRAADAVIVGKTNMDEFAMGSSGENSAYGPAKNPWDHSRIPGGSSSGSAVAVAAGMVPAALGSDTGGSIRQPAALSGVVGVKPSYGRVSRYGLVAFASSLDQVGPFARDVKSAARTLAVIAGNDARESTSSREAVGAYEAACERDVRGLRIGVPRDYAGPGLDAGVARSIQSAIARLESEGCEIRPIDLPHARYGVSTYYVVATAEASSNLARFDGVRYGLRIEPPGSSLDRMYSSTRAAGFGREVKRRILLGSYVLSAGYYDAYYKKAQQVRTLIRRDFEQAFAEVDAIAMPTSPTPAFPLGERVDDPLSMYLADVYTLPASLAGVAAISVPVAPTPAENSRPELPVGLQLIAPAFQEERLFTLAARSELLSPWQSRIAP